jgi:hypothetical protein
MLKSYRRNRTEHTKSLLLVAMMVAIDVCLAIIFGLNQSIDIPTFHLDGAYQTASGLYRLADGQLPGRDFYPYLGVGLTFFLYPFFLFAGNDVSASVFATHFLVACSFALVLGTITGLLAKSNRLLMGTAVGTFALTIILWLNPSLPPFFLELIDPGNSLRPLRSMIPYVVVVLTYLILKSRLQPIVLLSLISVLAGVAFLWTNDFGIPTTGLLVCFALFWARQQQLLTLPIALLIPGIALVSACVGLTIITSGYGFDLLSYNFQDVRFDQYWYFGPWSESSRIFTVSDIATKLMVDFGWWTLVLAIAAAKAYFWPTLENSLLFLIGLILAGGGSLAIVGGHRELGYLAAFFFWCKATLVVELFLIGKRFSLEWLGLKNNSSKFINTCCAIVIVCGLGALAQNFHFYLNERTQAQTDLDRFYVSELGGYLPKDYEDLVAMAREKKNEYVVEEYWGIWGALTRNQNRFPVDSVIHALGKIRDKFSAAVNENHPELAITTTRSTSIEWQAWSLSSNWWFYKLLLQRYSPTQISPTTIVWTKSREVPWPPIGCEVQSGENASFKLPEGQAGFYEIDLQLKEHLDIPRALLLVKNNLSNVTFIDGYVSLNPKNVKFQFPVAMVDSRSKDFDLKIIHSSPTDGHSIQLESCHARRVPFDDAEVLSTRYFVAERTAYNHTDASFLNGVGRTFPGFLLPITQRM